MRRAGLFLLVLLAGACSAAAQTNVNWGLQIGAEPRTLGVYDTSHTFTPVGTVNSASHVFMPTPATSTVPGSVLVQSGYLAATGLGVLANANLVSASLLATGAAAGNLGFVPLAPANNLSELTSAPSARTNLGLGSAATYSVGTTAGAVPLLGGSFVSGHCVSVNASSQLVDAGGSCTTGGGGGTVTSGTVGQLAAYTGATAVSSFLLTGDCSFLSGSITCTKTGGTTYAPSATTDTTNASNISSGTVAPARLPAAGVLQGAVTAQSSYTAVTGLGSAANSNIVVDISSQCTPDPTGATDMGPCINSAITAVKTRLSLSGGVPNGVSAGTVAIPCGTYKINTPVVLSSYVLINGGGRGCTVLNTNVGNAISTDPNKMVIFGGVANLSIRCVGACGVSNGLTLFSFQLSRFYNLEITGFASGSGIYIGPTNSAPAQDYVYGFFGTNGNVIFNHFENIVIQNANIAVYISGQIYGGNACSGGTAIDATDNDFSFIKGINVKYGVVTNHCNDSNHVSNFEYYGTTGGSCLLIGNDGVAADHDNYQLYFDGLCSNYSATLGSLSFITSNGNSWGHHIHIQTDEVYPLTLTGGHQGRFGACVSQLNSTTIAFSDLELPGFCNPIIPQDASGYGAGAVSAAILGADTMYFQASTQGGSVAPGYSFFGDPGVGVFHNGAGTVGLIGTPIIGYIQLYQNGGTFNTVGCSLGLTTDNYGRVACATNLAISTKTVSYAATLSDSSLIFSCTASCTLTLPAASGNAGFIYRVLTVAAFTVVSASANVVPLAGGAASTAILAATAGKWAVLQSDGVNWQIMEAN